MATETIMMYFRVSTTDLNNKDLKEKLLQIGSLCLEKQTGEPTEIELGGDQNRLLVMTGADHSHATLRIHDDGLLNLDINHASKKTSGTQKRDLDYIRSLEQKIKKFLEPFCKESNSVFCPLRRGQSVWPYVCTADERLYEEDFDALVCEVTSPYQTISILHSKQHGNVLHLDNDIMLGESDLIYTQTLCRIGVEDFTDKEILILGGGDGGILHELLKENPKFITMAEIDQKVIECCRTHMRSVCGSDMDCLEGPNYKIVIGDCILELQKNINDGHLFDYVINDLTEFPVEKEINGFYYDFKTTRKITELSLQAIKPSGKVLARGNCLSAIDYSVNFESDIKTLGCDFRKHTVYVPSFHENYCLYEIWKQ